MAVFKGCLRSPEFLPCDISRSEGGMCLLLTQEEVLGWSCSGDTRHLASSLGELLSVRSTVGGGDDSLYLLLPLWTAEQVEVFRPVL